MPIFLPNGDPYVNELPEEVEERHERAVQRIAVKISLVGVAELSQPLGMPPHRGPRVQSVPTHQSVAAICAMRRLESFARLAFVLPMPAALSEPVIASGVVYPAGSAVCTKPLTMQWLCAAAFLSDYSEVNRQQFQDLTASIPN